MPRKEKKYHFIYKTVNLITNKFYMGMHSTHDLEDNYLGSGKILKYSVNKYGKENHKLAILEFLPDKEKLKEREKEVVNEDVLKDPLCMNLMIGGKGGFDHISEKEMKIISQKGAKSTNKIMWIDNREENIKRISEQNKKSHEKGILHAPDWTGKKHSNKTKIKMSENKKENKSQEGHKNSQYGTCWITNNGVNKKIKIGELEKWINGGWGKGRVMK